MPSGERFAGKRAAVTGAGGFIGGAVAEALSAAGATVRGLDVVPPGHPSAGVEAVEADVTDLASVENAFEDVDLVVHAAAYVREWGTMEEFVEVNVRGTANVLEAAERAGVDRVVHISSVVVYGYDDPSEQGEEAFRRVNGVPYIDTKSASDRMAARRGAVIVRPGDVYGPGSVPWLVRQLEMARSNALAVPSPGNSVMLPVFIDDLVAAVLLAAQKGTPGASYTVWSGEAVTFRDYLAAIARIAEARPPRVLPRPLLELAGTAVESLARLRGRPPLFGAHAAVLLGRAGTASNERARAELGWEPRVSLDEGLQRCAEWARSSGLV